MSRYNVSCITDSHVWTSSGLILLRRQVNISEIIEPLAQKVNAKESAHEITLLGLRHWINLYLLQVDFFLNLMFSESNLEFFKPSNIVIIFLLKIASYFNWLFAKRLPLNNYALDLCSLLSFHACSSHDFFSTRILSWIIFDISESLRLKLLKVSY